MRLQPSRPCSTLRLLIALPVVGWALTSAHDIPLSFLGVIHLPKLVAADSELADNLERLHVWLAWGLLAAVAIHVAAALWHHFIRRDAVLDAMLPGRSGWRPATVLSPRMRFSAAECHSTHRGMIVRNDRQARGVNAASRNIDRQASRKSSVSLPQERFPDGRRGGRRCPRRAIRARGSGFSHDGPRPVRNTP